MASQRKSKTIISLALIIVFLLTAVVLPIVSSIDAADPTLGLVVNTSDANHKSGDQFPITEAENEKEESLSEEDSDISDSYLAYMFEKVNFSFAAEKVHPHEATSISPTSLPIYLSQRSLLI